MAIDMNALLNALLVEAVERAVNERLDSLLSNLNANNKDIADLDRRFQMLVGEINRGDDEDRNKFLAISRQIEGIQESLANRNPPHANFEASFKQLVDTRRMSDLLCMDSVDELKDLLGIRALENVSPAGVMGRVEDLEMGLDALDTRMAKAERAIRDMEENDTSDAISSEVRAQLEDFEPENFTDDACADIVKRGMAHHLGLEE